MYGVTISGKHSLDDYGLYLQPKSIPVPESKTTTVSIEGANGHIDLSTVLTNGNMMYENRSIELTFAVIGVGNEADMRIQTFVNEVHGKTHDFVFDDDTEHYYTGRFEVSKREYNNGYTLITVKVDADPYRYDIEVTQINRTISGVGVMNVTNARKWVVPTITASAEMTVQFEGVVYQVLEGRHLNDNIVLRDGTNTLVFSGNGTVLIEYRQGVL